MRKSLQQWWTVALVSAATLAAARAASAAFETPLGRPAMSRALAPVRWPTTDADRAAFHSRYVLDVPDEPIGVRLEEPAQSFRGVKRSFDSAGDSSDPCGCRITGTTIEAEFEAAPLARAVRPVVVDWNGPTLARVTIDFKSLQ